MADNNFDSTVKKSKKSSRKAAVIAIVSAFIIAAAGLYLCAEKLFFVKSIAVKNVTENYIYDSFPYSDEEMLSGLGIKIGDGLYSFNRKESEQSAVYNLPYIKEIRVSRRWPSTISAKVELENAAYYISVSDDLYILSDKLKVLEKTGDAEKIELSSLIYLKTGKIDHCIVGEQLGISEDLTKIIGDITDILSSESMIRNVKLIDVSDKFDISLMYDSKFEILLGDAKNLESKIGFMKRIIDDRGGDSQGGTIDVSDEDSREAVYKKFG